MHGGDRRLRPDNHHQAVNCPRCDSPNTKFCYYNNYNLSQPRYFCKNCRRYWTKGGVLRNVPVGGGCRKTRRSKPKLKPSGVRKSPNSGSSTDSSSAMFRAHDTDNDHPQVVDNMFTSEIAEFANLMSNSDDPLGMAGAAETTMTFNQFIQSNETTTLDPMLRIDDPTDNKGSNNPVVALDLGGDAGTCLFDLHGEFWNQTMSFPLFLP